MIMFINPVFLFQDNRNDGLHYMMMFPTIFAGHNIIIYIVSLFLVTSAINR